MNRRMTGNAVQCQGIILARSIGAKAWRALLEEVYTTPKPGLVDLYSCGAHSDMNVSIFEKSAQALHPYFIQMAALGYEMSGSPEELFHKIREVGVEAERAMCGATYGVNTHKGLLFTLGIFCAAAGRCIREDGKLTEKKLFDMEQQMVAKILFRELGRIETKEPESHGEKNLKIYGTLGIRGEAINGYPAIRNIALPVLRQGISERKEWNLVKLQTLFHLMSEVEDSNIISRHNPQVLFQVHMEAKEFLKCGGAYAEDATEKLQMMDEDYIRRNISAGGCADLLAAAIFIELLLNTENPVLYRKMSEE
ncbi:MAG: triphosphoribosyl-dephospho-CoA synthase CitG [Eubacteriales bacterium]|nr:triphosphoribosyl-dephospho-CoA synthase CitG [Eubacteriales bacterium]